MEHSFCVSGGSSFRAVAPMTATRGRETQVRCQCVMVIWLGPIIRVNSGGQTEYRRSAECLDPPCRRWFSVRPHRLYRSKEKKVQPQKENSGA